jgi:rubrerythrin
MEMWVCKNCNFRFRSNRPLDCPYCEKKDLERVKSAGEYLEEVENLLNG